MKTGRLIGVTVSRLLHLLNDPDLLLCNLILPFEGRDCVVLTMFDFK